jgi:hypothetical protein
MSLAGGNMIPQFIPELTNPNDMRPFRMSLRLVVKQRHNLTQIWWLSRKKISYSFTKGERYQRRDIILS